MWTNAKWARTTATRMGLASTPMAASHAIALVDSLVTGLLAKVCKREEGMGTSAGAGAAFFNK